MKAALIQVLGARWERWVAVHFQPEIITAEKKKRAEKKKGREKNIKRGRAE